MRQLQQSYLPIIALAEALGSAGGNEKIGLRSLRKQGGKPIYPYKLNHMAMNQRQYRKRVRQNPWLSKSKKARANN